jgi:S-DNA-T family DNA segregation ATPase FtsK/SpoIIIE
MIDSRVILDQPGAEKLLGKGDMLYVPPDASKAMRIQGVYVSDAEIRNLIGFLKRLGVEPEYTEEVIQMPVGKMKAGTGGSGESDDLFEEAVRTICQYDRASASLLQRRLRVGYARAARLLDELESEGIVGPGEGSKPRDVLVKNPDEYFQAKSKASQPAS